MDTANNIENANELNSIFGDDTAIAIQKYYRLNNETKVIWMQQPAHKLTHIKHGSRHELVVFEEWWISSAMSWLLIAYSQVRNELFIAGEVLEGDSEVG